MKRQNKLIGLMLIGSLISVGYLANESKYMSKTEKEVATNQMNHFFGEVDKYKKKKDFDRKIQNKIKEISEFKNSEEYKIREIKVKTLNSLRDRTGIDIDDFEKINFELSFYTDLPCENTPGQRSICANGEELSSSTIANNVLNFDTKVYMEGYGLKEVDDRGSQKYFKHIERCDVFVPRNGKESDDAYKSRVNNMGMKHVDGYILKVDK